MARQFFVVPREVELPLFPDENDGVYIIAKEKLTYGEAQVLQSASMTSVHFNSDAQEGDTEIGLDLKRHAILRMLTWINDWNLPDPVTGKTLPVNKSTIENLDPETAAEITRVLDEHVKTLEKNAPTRIALVSETTSTS